MYGKSMKKKPMKRKLPKRGERAAKSKKAGGKKKKK